MAVEDLSSMCEGLVAGSSMSASNTVSETPPYTAPGSTGEAVAGVAIHVVPDVTDTPLSDHRRIVN